MKYIQKHELRIIQCPFASGVLQLAIANPHKFVNDGEDPMR